MSIDSNVTGITGVGGFGGGAAMVAAELAGTGHSVLIGIATGLSLVAIAALLMRRAHRNIISE